MPLRTPVMAVVCTTVLTFLSSHSLAVEKTTIRPAATLKKSTVRPLIRQPAESPPAEDQQTEEAGNNQQEPPPVVITSATWQLDNCQYRASISIRNDSSNSYQNLHVGLKQKAPNYSSWHGAGAVLVSSLAPGQSVTKNLNWTRDIRANEFFAYVNETEISELDRETLDIGGLNASIGDIRFSGSGAQAQWEADISNNSSVPICGGVTIIRKRETGGGMSFAASNTSGITVPVGSSTLSGTWDATNATKFNLRFGADSGAARNGFWTLDEKEVNYSP